MLDLTPEEISVYREQAIKRLKLSLPERTRLQNLAWEEARRVADLLRERFKTTRMAVFGSLVHPGCFTKWSDIDMAVWGLASEDSLRALGAAIDAGSPFEINLVDINTARHSLLSVIEKEGIDI